MRDLNSTLNSHLNAEYFAGILASDDISAQQTFDPKRDDELTSLEKIYLDYMEEIKWRLGNVGAVLSRVREDPTSRKSVLDAEFAYLQIRFVCELIALASLSAHHSYGLNKTLLKSWHADEIFSELEKINQFCFPVPISSTRDRDGMLHFTANEADGMTRSKLKAVYGRCGNALHRGFLRHVLSGKTRTYDMNELGKWYGSLMRLLNEHMILFPKEERAILLNMQGGKNGEVMIVYAEADGPFKMVQQDTK